MKWPLIKSSNITSHKLITNKYKITEDNSKDLEVKHNVPINEDYNKRLDNDNLLTVCHYHHEMCESGEIQREDIQKIIDEQEDKVSPLYFN